VTDLTERIKEEYRSTIGVGEFQLPRFLEKPIHIGDALVRKLDEQRKWIDDFFKTVATLGKMALQEEDAELVNLLFSQPVEGMTKEYHRSLPDSCWTIPIVYRTDQSVSGKIYEIQAPGSGWGDIPLLVNVFQRLGHTIPEPHCNFANAYADTIVAATGKSEPSVYHMIDASSAPASMRYLLAVTANRLRYWGISSNITLDRVDYITAHSAAALTTSNYFRTYMARVSTGETVFGIPPNLIFDQKAIYLLPFHRLTRLHFSDEIRDLFPFTTLIEHNGFYDKGGSFVSIGEFVKRPRRDRLYYLKYGGPDLCRNWGSRAVHRLDGNDCEKRLNDANALSQHGEIWLMQEDVSKENIQNAAYSIREIDAGGVYIKLSAFNGIRGQLGIRMMVRSHFKVHGQADTQMGVCVN